jgi:predicted house-cleaning noncanonical NTP pyrophosphatase (MazG superfamily)
MTYYNKLVRDRIPQILEAQGKEFIAYKAAEEDYPSYLKKKLVEEVHEFLETPSLKELADVQEVINAILKEMGYYQGDLRSARAQKIEERGAFNDRWVLGEVKDD